VDSPRFRLRLRCMLVFIDRVLETPASHAASKRRRRQVAVPQAAIARAVRVAGQAGPTWRVSIEGNVINLFQGESIATTRQNDKVAPEKNWRL